MCCSGRSIGQALVLQLPSLLSLFTFLQSEALQPVTGLFNMNLCSQQVSYRRQEAQQSTLNSSTGLRFPAVCKVCQHDSAETHSLLSSKLSLLSYFLLS